MHNLKLEGRIMFKYNLQRSDLVYVAVRYRSVSSNLGLSRRLNSYKAFISLIFIFFYVLF